MGTECEGVHVRVFQTGIMSIVQAHLCYSRPEVCTSARFDPKCANAHVLVSTSTTHDDDTSVLNLSNYNTDGSPEAPNFTWALLEETKASGKQGWIGRNLLGF